MPLVGAKLYHLFSTKPVARAARAMAGTAGARQTELTRRYAPKDTGRSAKKIHQSKVVRVGTAGGPIYYKTTTYTNNIVMVVQNYGSGLWGPSHSYYLITASRARRLRFTINGKTFKLEHVWHPGVKGKFFFEKAQVQTVSEFNRLVAGHLRTWADDQERTAAMKPFITYTPGPL